MTSRRGAIAGGIAMALVGRVAFAREKAMFGMIGKLTAKPGQRDALTKLLLAGSTEMPGCLSYIVSEDLVDADVLWVSEAWADEASHKASLQIPAVKAAIGQAMPLIAGFDTAAQTRPIGGIGLSPGR